MDALHYTRYSRRKPSERTRASATVAKSVTDRNSSRKRPWKLSRNPFCQGFSHNALSLARFNVGRIDAPALTRAPQRQGHELRAVVHA